MRIISSSSLVFSHEMAHKPPIAAKVVIIGDSAVGKTSLRNRYLHNHFTLSYRATIGADFVTKSISIGHGPNERRVSLAIWDTAGQERFQSLGAAFYRGADACVLVFSATSQPSLDHLPNWFQQFVDRYPLLHGEERDICWVAVANKSDVYDHRHLPSSPSPSPSIDEYSSIVDPSYAKKLVRSILPPPPPSFANKSNSSKNKNRTSQNNLSSSTLTLPPYTSADNSVAQESSFYSISTTTPQQQHHQNYLSLNTDPSQSTLRSSDPDDIRGKNNRKSYLPPSSSVYHTPSSTNGGIPVPSTMNSTRPDRSRSRHSSTTFTTSHSPPYFYSPAHSTKSSSVSSSPSTSSSLPETLSPSRTSNANSAASTLSQRSYATDIYSFNNFDVEIDDDRNINNTDSRHNNDRGHEPNAKDDNDNDDDNDDDENGPMKLFFTSAKSGSNVDDIFTYIARRIVKRIEKEDYQKSHSKKKRNNTKTSPMLFSSQTTSSSPSPSSSSSSFNCHSIDDNDDDDITPHASPHQEYLFHSLHSRNARNNSAFHLSMDNNKLHSPTQHHSQSWKSKCC